MPFFNNNSYLNVVNLKKNYRDCLYLLFVILISTIAPILHLSEMFAMKYQYFKNNRIFWQRNDKIFLASGVILAKCKHPNVTILTPDFIPILAH